MRARSATRFVVPAFWPTRHRTVRRPSRALIFEDRAERFRYQIQEMLRIAHVRQTVNSRRADAYTPLISGRYNMKADMIANSRP